MKALKPVRISGKEVLPLVEGGKGIAVSNGDTAGAWAAAGAVGTFSGVTPDRYDSAGRVIPEKIKAKTPRSRHEELIRLNIEGGVTQARRAHDIAGGKGRIHVNVLWEMGGSRATLDGLLQEAGELIHGVTCGAGMPYQLAELCARHRVYYYPIVSSDRAFRALWKRGYRNYGEYLGGVVYEDPWNAGGHNGLSNSEDPRTSQPPLPRVVALRRMMNEAGLENVPVIVAGGVWFLREWESFIDNPDVGPVAFQIGSRALLTRETPVAENWRKELMGLKKGDVSLQTFSPTGFYSSAVRNRFLERMESRWARQIPYRETADETHSEKLAGVWVTPPDLEKARGWQEEGYEKALKTPDSTLVFISTARWKEIKRARAECIGCLSRCLFSAWAQSEEGTTGRIPDPRTFCIHNSLMRIAHGGDPQEDIMFAGHNAYRFGEDPLFPVEGPLPTVQELVDRLMEGE